MDNLTPIEISLSQIIDKKYPARNIFLFIYCVIEVKNLKSALFHVMFLSTFEQKEIENFSLLKNIKIFF